MAHQVIDYASLVPPIIKALKRRFGGNRAYRLYGFLPESLPANQPYLIFLNAIVAKPLNL